MLVQAAPALAQTSGWNISSFASDITVNKDSSIDVTETIVADFSREEHHGIIRSIPVSYRDDFSNKLSLQFNLKSVTDETGKDWTYDKYYEGDSVYLKIGDADTYLNEPTTFVIKYGVVKAINFFKDHDELYWNATGTEWDVPMQKVTSTISLPGGVNDADIKTKCYTGYYGASDGNCIIAVTNGKITFAVSNPGAAIEAGQGLTMVIGWPKNIVAQPSALQVALWFLYDNWGFFLPFLTFGLLYYLWSTRGRDPQISRSAIMPLYEPPDKLTPTELGTIIDESADTRDISSAIIDLAVRGYLKINETKSKKFLFETTEYEFEKLKEFDMDPALKDHEKLILRAVFGNEKTRKLSDLQNKFYTHIEGIKTQIYSQLITDGYFPSNPEKIRNTYYAIGGAMVGITIFGIGGFIVFFSFSVPVGVILSGIIVLLFAGKMPAKTKKGAETFIKIKGLEEFINTAEKDRIKWQEKENIFEKLLPYAITLGLAQRWSSAFEGIYKNPPSWYNSTNPTFGTNFSTMHLLNSLNHMNTTMASTLTSAPRSSSSGSSWGGHSGFSGGFSGGGFGGGGGSAW